MATKTTTRKKKVKRSFTKGVAHIHSTFNNTIITITDADSVNNMIWALFSIFPAVIAILMIGLIYIYPIKK